MESDIRVIWATGVGETERHVAGTVIALYKKKRLTYRIGLYREDWVIERFKPCEETPELLRALGLICLR